MTGIELTTLWNEAGIVGIEADRLAFLKWRVRTGRLAEGVPGGPLPDMRYAADADDLATVCNWTAGRTGGGVL